jgi:hypothetical protein
MKSLSITLLALSLLAGCVKVEEAVTYPEPTPDALNLAIDNAVTTLNEKTGSHVERLVIDWIEVPNNCRPHLDYFAQQVLWARIYQDSVDETSTLYIDCTVAQQYKDDAAKLAQKKPDV